MKEQKCPKCSLREAAGSYCSGCLTSTADSHYAAKRPVRQSGTISQSDRKKPATGLQQSLGGL